MQTKISKGTRCKLPVVLPLGNYRDSLSFSEAEGDKTYGASPTQEASVSRDFTELSHLDMADDPNGRPLSPAPSEVELRSCDPKPRVNNIVRPSHVSRGTQGKNTLFRQIK